MEDFFVVYHDSVVTVYAQRQGSGLDVRMTYSSQETGKVLWRRFVSGVSLCMGYLWEDGLLRLDCFNMEHTWSAVWRYSNMGLVKVFADDVAVASGSRLVYDRVGKRVTRIAA